MDAVVFALLCVVGCIRRVSNCTHCLLSKVGGKGRSTGGEGRMLNCLALLSEVGGEGQGPGREERGKESEAGRRREGGSQGGGKRKGKRERREEAGGQTVAVVLALLCVVGCFKSVFEILRQL